MWLAFGALDRDTCIGFDIGVGLQEAKFDAETSFWVRAFSAAFALCQLRIREGSLMHAIPGTPSGCNRRVVPHASEDGRWCTGGLIGGRGNAGADRDGDGSARLQPLHTDQCFVCCVIVACLWCPRSGHLHWRRHWRGSAVCQFRRSSTLLGKDDIAAKSALCQLGIREGSLIM